MRDSIGTVSSSTTARTIADPADAISASSTETAKTEVSTSSGPAHDCSDAERETRAALFSRLIINASDRRVLDVRYRECGWSSCDTTGTSYPSWRRQRHSTDQERRISTRSTRRITYAARSTSSDGQTSTSQARTGRRGDLDLDPDARISAGCRRHFTDASRCDPATSTSTASPAHDRLDRSGRGRVRSATGRVKNLPADQCSGRRPRWASGAALASKLGAGADPDIRHAVSFARSVGTRDFLIKRVFDAK